MDPRVSEIFTRALEMPDAARKAFLTDACGTDEALAQRVRRMLADSRKADEFFRKSTDGQGSHHSDETTDY